MYYDSSASLFYIANEASNQIDVFSTSLTLTKSINLGSYNPYGVSVYNESLYVGVYTGNVVLVLQNSVITKVFSINSCTSGLFTSVIFDFVGYMAIVCYLQNSITLYDYNGNYMNVVQASTSYPYILDIDAAGRMILTTARQLDIYY